MIRNMFLKYQPKNRVFSEKMRNFSCLVIAEIQGDSISSSTLSAVTAATQLNQPISLLVVGKGTDKLAAEGSKITGVNTVLVIDDLVFETKVPEIMATTVASFAPQYNYIIAPSSNWSKNYLPRAAALVDCSPLSDVLKINSADTFERPMYAGNAIATVQMTDKIKFLLVRSTVFDKAKISPTPLANVTKQDLQANKVSDLQISTFLSENISKSDRPDLGSAKVVISGGRGMKSRENFAILNTLADKLGGAVGASRAAVDSGFAPNDYQVGQTGKVVAPDLYIAVGISGAIQHLSGMKDSKVIVAINKDKDAPIFQVADYGLVEDLFKAVPEITSKL